MHPGTGSPTPTPLYFHPLSHGPRSASIPAIAYPPAEIWRRAVAFVIDDLTQATIGVWLAFALLVVLPLSSDEGDYIIGAVDATYLIAFLLSLLYRPICESHWGATLGKLIFKIRVIQSDGRFPSFPAALLRLLCLFVEGSLFGIPAAIIMAANPQHHNRRLGDRAAGTEVILLPRPPLATISSPAIAQPAEPSTPGTPPASTFPSKPASVGPLYSPFAPNVTTPSHTPPHDPRAVTSLCPSCGATLPFPRAACSNCRSLPPPIVPSG